MGHVKGIGGLFFRARDPEALSAWYKERLGIGAGCNADDTGPIDEWTWNVSAGPVVFAPFKADTDYFDADRQFMINLRVDDLDAVLMPFHDAGDDPIGVGRSVRQKGYEVRKADLPFAPVNGDLIICEGCDWRVIDMMDYEEADAWRVFVEKA